jgi:phospholipid transport system substrate-binding protein
MKRDESPLLSRRQILLAAAATLTLTGIPLRQREAGAATGPETYVQSLGNDVIALAKSGARGSSLRSRFVSLLQRHSDIRGIALFSLGTYQKRLPAGERSKYFDLVIRYAAGFFAYYIEDFAGTGFDVKSSRPRGKSVEVESAIRYDNGSTAPVRWSVVKSGGGYRVNDVNVRGIWLSLQMQQQFTSVLKRNKGDFDALFKYLRENA